MTTGLDASVWLAGVACGAVLNALLARAQTRHTQVGLGPADHVTVAHAVFACGVAALTVDSFGGHAPVTILVALSSARASGNAAGADDVAGLEAAADAVV